ncbi:hypothetical protein TARUN_5920 [Trichoderma arundinaceum]|uniref:EF-hand domain-containing protein n=1 Tax=Trichoderma arundinaceum TaxID=490622 RepID=A0A395NJQ0_TRIAR|nr:hypothetical protein TARUN_5920 [Trichoderma arundinaceum]
MQQQRRNGTPAAMGQQRQAADDEANGRMLQREGLGGIVCSVCDESSLEESRDRGSISTTFKPSPLGYGSPPSVRNSPFRRGDSPASPSPLRYTTPTSSPTKAATTPNGTSRFARPTTPTATEDPQETKELQKTPVMTTPTRASPPSWKATSKLAVGGSLGGSNALSQLQPTQVRTLRDGFQILDRDCDGVVNREDVADMLGQLGLPSGSSDIGRFFPPSKPQTITLAAFLNSLAESLALLSPNTELLSAFSAFDEDDSGQIDWAELRDALLNTPPEAGQSALSAAEVDKVVEGFTGRRAFNRNMNAHLSARRGEVFKYQEFVHSIMGSNGGSEGGSHDRAEE